MLNTNYKLQEMVFFAVLILTAAALPFSEALISISTGLLLFQTIVLRSWKHPSVKGENVKMLLFPVSIFLIYLFGTFFTNNFQLALRELNKSIFWLIVPLAIYFSPRLPALKIYTLFGIFICAVIISSFVSTGRLIFTDSFHLSDFRQLSLISHIRFSFQVGFAILLLIWFLLRNPAFKYSIPPVWLLAGILWLLIFLFLLKSLIGIMAFFITGLVTLLYFAVKVQIKLKIPLIAFLVAFIIFPLLYVGKVAGDYYNFKMIDPDTVDVVTPSGNPYVHDFDSYLRENGHLVFVYLCEEELRHEWNKRSEIKYDDDLNGFPLSSTLIRYLSSLGYRKDSTGVSKLTSSDIQLIERGATNYRFKNHFLSIYPRVYETVWEMDHYLNTEDPNNKTFAQRIEFTKAAVHIIKKHPLFGVGTGNWEAAYNDAYNSLGSQLNKENRRPAHNQYLNYLVKFGLVGFLWITFALITPIFIYGHKNNFMMIFLMILIGVANFGDANMETHMGLSFFIFFYSLLLWNSPEEMKLPIYKH